jgi:acid phosphatase type 7
MSRLTLSLMALVWSVAGACVAAPPSSSSITSVGDDDAVRLRFARREASASGKITLVGAGDIANCTASTAAQSDAALTARLVDGVLSEADRKGEVALVFTLGDNVYDAGLPREFDECYGPTWGRFAARTLPVLGNHDRGNPEVGTSEALGFFGFFDVRLRTIDREHNKSSGTVSKGYYKVELSKDWLAIVLDSTYTDTGKPEFADPGSMFRDEITWLKSALAAKPSGQCVIALWHHPPGTHSCGKSLDTDTLCERFLSDSWRLLQRHAGLVLTGHEHAYRRYERLDADRKPSPNGVLQITVGTGGKEHFTYDDQDSLTDNTAPRPSSTGIGVLRLGLRPGIGEFEYVQLPAGDRPAVFDRGTFACASGK